MELRLELIGLPRQPGPLRCVEGEATQVAVQTGPAALDLRFRSLTAVDAGAVVDGLATGLVGVGSVGAHGLLFRARAEALPNGMQEGDLGLHRLAGERIWTTKGLRPQGGAQKQMEAMIALDQTAQQMG